MTDDPREVEPNVTRASFETVAWRVRKKNLSVGTYWYW